MHLPKLTKTSWHKGIALSFFIAPSLALWACVGGAGTSTSVPTFETEAQNAGSFLDADIGLFSTSNMDEFQRFIDTSTKFISHNPQDVGAYLKRGLTYNKIGEYEKAIQDFDEVIRLDPDSPEAYLGRGVAYFNLSLRHMAIDDFNEAIRLNSEYAQAYVSRGAAYFDMDETQLALQDFDQATRLQPKSPEAYALRAVVYYLLQRDREALPDIRKALELGMDQMDLDRMIEQAVLSPKSQETTS